MLKGRIVGGLMLGLLLLLTQYLAFGWRYDVDRSDFLGKTLFKSRNDLSYFKVNAYLMTPQTAAYELLNGPPRKPSDCQIHPEYEGALYVAVTMENDFGPRLGKFRVALSGEKVQGNYLASFPPYEQTGFILIRPTHITDSRLPSTLSAKVDSYISSPKVSPEPPKKKTSSLVKLIRGNLQLVSFPF